jgi:hypothetical protein
MAINLKNKLTRGMSIYTIPSKDQMMGESEMGYNPRDDIENKFIRAIAELVCEAMDISHNDRRVVTALLVNTLSDSINNRGGRHNRAGLLQQFLAHELETIAKSVRGGLMIPEEVAVNHEHVTHAMFGDIISYIQENFVRKDDINSDGTFETIIEKRRELMSDGPMTESCDEACCESPG